MAPFGPGDRLIFAGPSLLSGPVKKHGFQLFEPDGIGRNAGLSRRENWTGRNGFESCEVGKTSFKPMDADSIRSFRVALVNAANEDPEIAKFVDSHPELGISRRDAPLVWTPESDADRKYFLKD